jgi:signal peptidase I
MRTLISRMRWRWLLPALGLALAFRQWVWMPTIVAGRSMEPTLHSGHLAGINKLAYRRHSPRRGDTVVIRTGRDLIIKRILGLPGEEVAILDGVVYINGQPLAEPYVRSAGNGSIAPGRLGPNRFVAAGDYRTATVIAVVSRDRIVGRLMF